MEYDLCIVGAGMIGSSAARHAAALGKRVCLVGPEEPKSRYGHDIFGAHYDEGRITRSTASEFVWAVVNSRSIARYRHLERESGIKFYHEVGCLTVGHKSGLFLQKSLESAKRQELPSVDLLPSVSELKKRFPYLGIYNPNIKAIFETRNAGYINPRRLVEIQQKLAQKDGCVIVREVADSVDEKTDAGAASGGGGGAVVMKVTTERGREILAKKVLLATGAFTEARSLLPPGLRLDLEPVTQGVVFAELSAEDQEKLRNMPSMHILENDPLLTEESGQALQATDYDSYILPPIKYPDGKVYLKLGHGNKDEKVLKSPAEISQWFTSKLPKDCEQSLLRILKLTFPDLKPVSLHTDSCVTVNTPTRLPYIDTVTPQLTVALGDNGYSAKCCDELGRLAARLALTGKWEDDLPKEAFRAVVKRDGENSKL